MKVHREGPQEHKDPVQGRVEVGGRVEDKVGGRRERELVAEGCSKFPYRPEHRLVGTGLGTVLARA